MANTLDRKLFRRNYTFTEYLNGRKQLKSGYTVHSVFDLDTVDTRKSRRKYSKKRKRVQAQQHCESRTSKILSPSNKCTSQKCGLHIRRIERALFLYQLKFRSSPSLGNRWTSHCAVTYHSRPRDEGAFKNGNKYSFQSSERARTRILKIRRREGGGRGSELARRSTCWSCAVATQHNGGKSHRQNSFAPRLHQLDRHLRFLQSCFSALNATEAELSLRPVASDGAQSVEQLGLHARLHQHDVHVHLKQRKNA